MVGFYAFRQPRGANSEEKTLSSPREADGCAKSWLQILKGGRGDTAKLLSVTPDCNKKHRLRTGAREARDGCRKGSRCEVLLSCDRDPLSWCTLHPWGF